MVMRRPRRRAGGFTLIEMVIVIAISGVIAAMIAVFIKSAIDSYFDSIRRAELTDRADLTLRRLEREIRLAVPNSLRMKTVGNVVYLEFVPSKDGGRYRNEGDGSTGGKPLCSGGAINPDFDVLGPSPAIEDGDFVVVFNDASLNRDTGAGCTVPHDVYCSGSRAKVDGTDPLTSPLSFDVSDELDNQNLICQYGNNRFQVVDKDVQAVTYACRSDASGELLRYENYGFNTAQVTPPVGVAPALMVGEARCDIDFFPDAMRRIGLLYITLTLTHEGESISAFRQIRVDNTP